MTNETDVVQDAQLRTLFEGVDLGLDQTPRDLIGPAMAWGRYRRRLDRYAVAGGAGVLATAAVAGVIAFGGPAATGSAVTPGGKGAPPTTAHPYTREDFKNLSIADTETEIYAELTKILPAGYTFKPAGTDPETSAMSMTNSLEGMLTGPTGSAITRIQRFNQVGEQSLTETAWFVAHQATAADPIVSGTVPVAGGTVEVEARDYKDGYTTGAINPDKQAKIIGNRTDYDYLPADPSQPPLFISMSALTTSPSVVGGLSLEQLEARCGFSPNGPLLTPGQFAGLAANPGWEKINALQDHLWDAAWAEGRHRAPASATTPRPTE